MKPLSLVDRLLIKLSLRTPSDQTAGVPSEKSKLPSNRGKLCDADKAVNQPAFDQLAVPTINSDSINSTSNSGTFTSLTESIASSTANFIVNTNSSQSPECYRPSDKDNQSAWRKEAGGNRQHERVRSQMKNHLAAAPRSKRPSAGDLCKHKVPVILLTFIQFVTLVARAHSMTRLISHFALQSIRMQLVYSDFESFRKSPSQWSATGSGGTCHNAV